MAETFFDKIYKSKTMHTPDVLSCLANLSNDEVFTPPDVVNKMLDLLPQELFKDPNATFLDPACKTGVFLREIAKRLLVGLKDKIPDLQQRIDHIFHKQLFGIAITELTSLLSRRSLYCSKYPNGEYSVSRFDSPEGNIRFRRIKHTWVNEKCKFCGASKEQWDRGEGKETHAYEFIHTLEPEKIFNMKFDVIISNPPYQLSTSEIDGKSNAIPIYHQFVNMAKKLEPNYIVMIIPARWMTGGTRALDAFREAMINDSHISIMHDYLASKDVFTGVDVKGGICYFVRDKKHTGKCQYYTHSTDGVNCVLRKFADEGTEFIIRNNNSINIKNKIWKSQHISVASIASPQTPYGLLSNAFIKEPEKFTIVKEDENQYRVFGLGINLKREMRYLRKNVKLSKQFNEDSYKVFIPEVYGSGEMGETPPQPIVGVPHDICTQTFRQFGGFSSKREAENFCKYIKTKIFRLMTSMLKNTHHAPSKVYMFIPMQDFTEKSDIDWSVPIPDIDKQLYKKYDLTQEEIDFIESMIKPME